MNVQHKPHRVSLNVSHLMELGFGSLHC